MKFLEFLSGMANTTVFPYSFNHQKHFQALEFERCMLSAY